MSGLKALWFQW